MKIKKDKSSPYVDIELSDNDKKIYEDVIGKYKCSTLAERIKRELDDFKRKRADWVEEIKKIIEERGQHGNT